MGAMDTKWNHHDCKCIEDNGALEIYIFIKTKWFYKYQIYKYLMKQTFIIFKMTLDIFQWKNMVCFVQIPQQSYLKVFRNVTLIVFCTGIYMEKNNLRVRELKCWWLRCYILNQKDSGSTIKA